MENKNDYVSSVKELPYAPSLIFQKLQDLRNFDKLREAFTNPTYANMISAQIGEDKAKKVASAIGSVTCTQDSISAPTPLGNISLQIVDREEPKCIKFEGQGAPVPTTAWVQLLPKGEGGALLRVTLRAELNFFLRKMMDSKLNSAVEQVADMLARLPYNVL